MDDFYYLKIAKNQQLVNCMRSPVFGLSGKTSYLISILLILKCAMAAILQQLPDGLSEVDVILAGGKCCHLCL